MDWQAALRRRWITAAPIAALLADYADTKAVFWDERPQDAKLTAAAGAAHMLLQVISAPREHDMAGTQAVQWARVQVDCLSMSRRSAFDLATAVVTEAESAATIEGVKFLRAKVEGPVSRGERTETGFIHRQQVDLMFFYSQTQGGQ